MRKIVWIIALIALLLYCMWEDQIGRTLLEMLLEKFIQKVAP